MVVLVEHIVCACKKCPGLGPVGAGRDAGGGCGGAFLQERSMLSFCLQIYWFIGSAVGGALEVFATFDFRVKESPDNLVLERSSL